MHTNYYSCVIFVFLPSFFFLHFLRRCGSSFSFFLCCFTRLVLLLPLWMLMRCLWFFLLVAPDPLLLALSSLFVVHCVVTPWLLLLFWMNDCIVFCFALKQGIRRLKRYWKGSRWALFQISKIHITITWVGFFTL